MLVVGTRVIYRAVADRVVHCERCGGDRPFKLRSGRRWAHLLGIPLCPLGTNGEHLRCTVCQTCYRVELLAVPTLDQMHAALLSATSVAVLAMLHAGDPASRAARRRAIDLIKNAGSADYSQKDLAADLADADRVPGQGREATAGSRVELAVQTLALQLEPHAREWFLSKIVQVGLADGALSARERDAIATIARYLGMSQARAEDVISMTEEAAQAG